MPRRLLAPSAIELERKEASDIHASLVAASRQDCSDGLDRARCYLSAHSVRRAALLREASVLKALTEIISELSISGPRAQETFFVAALGIVRALIVSGEGAKEFVAYGGHGVLLRLLASSNDNIVSEVDALLVEGGQAATNVGLPFPTLHVKGFLAEGEVANGHLWQYNFEGGENGEAAAVVVQPVTEAQESQFTVGYLMWPAAVVLGRWLRQHPAIVTDLTVHELGAGLGLSGLACAEEAKSVVLSDFNERCVANLAVNIDLNGLSNICRAKFLDWSAEPDVDDFNSDDVNGNDDNSHQSDLLIAADVVCQTNDAVILARALRNHVQPLGAAVIVLPDPRHRFGACAFPSSLSEAGLQFRVYEVTDASLLAGIEEAKYFTWHAYLAWIPPTSPQVPSPSPLPPPGEQKDTNTSIVWPSAWHSELHAALMKASGGGPDHDTLLAHITRTAAIKEPMLSPKPPPNTLQHEESHPKVFVSKGLSNATPGAEVSALSSSTSMMPNLPLEPTAEVNHLAAQELIEAAQILAKSSGIETSLASKSVQSEVALEERADDEDEEDMGNAVRDAATGFLAGFSSSEEDEDNDDDEASRDSPLANTSTNRQ